jgi:hypothetical protein
MDVERLEAELRLGRIDAGRGHEIAAQALEAGHDVPAIYDLLAVERDRLGLEAKPLLERLARELGQTPLTAEGAWLVLACRVAARVEVGELEPAEGVGELFGLWLESEHPALAPAADLYVGFEYAEAMRDTVSERETGDAARRWLRELAARQL